MSCNGIKQSIRAEHPTRKHGIQKDKYFVIRYQHQGKRKEKGFGWASDNWTVEKAAFELALLKKAEPNQRSCLFFITDENAI